VTEEAHSPSARLNHEARRRVLLDAEGRKWTVFESTLPYDRRGTCTLVFESVDVMRRVRDFPPDWFERSDDALLALSDRI
jgi:hypothetical protein